MPDVRNISNWTRQEQVQTTGSREKAIFISPNKGDKYYFKTSYKTKDRYYKYEFWSEIIASRIGNMLGFDIISYDIAWCNDRIGCLSKSIIDDTKEDHHEGYRFITAVDKKFVNNFKKTHSFQRIEKALKKIDLEHCIEGIINMIIFDALIGNRDRHSENWAIVIKVKNLHDALKLLEEANPVKKGWWNLIHKLNTFGKGPSLGGIIKTLHLELYKLSPIYDSGSSLGRELDDTKLLDCVTNVESLRRYANRGKPDIRWNNEWLTHIELIHKIRSKHKSEVDRIIKRIAKKYDLNQLTGIVNNIDKKLPLAFDEYKISETRKDFIIKYVDLRIKDLLEIK